ncbi:MGLL [Lepeophtheirus salmonis]|uniref:MGLL n=1 Tax=Lepeophtheirus salmonis TaxID=72036 RepID=A0A7R8D357_LEPSM|nr:MGLL [Lepeophtheirus salmonis]CAF3009367.1 MGLL [Lepeophtheirus salmonis]
MRVRTRETYMTTPKGLTFFRCEWSHPILRIRGLVFISHGLGEHMGYYSDVAVHLVRLGYIVFGHDHPGHGYSSDSKEDMFRECIECTLFDITVTTQSKYGNKYSLFIIGHSIGALIALTALKKMPDLFSGAVLVAPPFKGLSKLYFKPLFNLLLPFLSYFYPSYQIVKMSLNQLTRDVHQVKRMEKDPLYSKLGLKARSTYLIHQTIKTLQSRAHEIQVPLFIQQGACDGFTDPLSAQSLFDSVGSRRKHIKMYDGAYHHLYIDIPSTKKEAISDAVTWIYFTQKFA